MKLQPKHLASSLCVVSLTFVACSDATTRATTSDSGSPPVSGDVGSNSAAVSKDIVDTAVGAKSFTTLVAAVQAAGLEATLRSAGPFTVFAPTDTAFTKVPKFLTDKLLTPPYKTELGLVLKYHVVAGLVRASDILGKTSTSTTVLGAKLAVDGSGGKVLLNGAVNVTIPDVQASNGIVHIVDGVLLPTIADTAVGYDDGTTTFKTLVAALTAGDLAATLGGPGPFTVFAPTDAAFAKVPKATLDSLLLPANKAQLQKILKYHVIASSLVYAKDITAGSVNSLSGPIGLTIVGSEVSVDAGGAKAKVILTDLPASNGVVHVIDTVILPPN
ncbi:MAG: fasciclin domain-containing protein [Myxococcota bacterium]|nr:fasciclin domain-containing protein [Myxococcota bacterium]